jgi:hypothetical protein
MATPKTIPPSRNQQNTIDVSIHSASPFAQIILLLTNNDLPKAKTICLLCRRNPKLRRYDFCGDACKEDAMRKTPLLLEVPKGHVTFEMGESSHAFHVVLTKRNADIVEGKFKASWNCPQKRPCPRLKKVFKILETPKLRAEYHAYKYVLIRPSCGMITYTSYSPCPGTNMGTSVSDTTAPRRNAKLEILVTIIRAHRANVQHVPFSEHRSR